MVEYVCNGFCPFKIKEFGYDPPVPIPTTTDPKRDGWAFVSAWGAEEGNGSWICPECSERLKGKRE